MEEIIDKSDMRTVLENFPKQILDALKLGASITIKGVPERIIIAGMGGSALPGFMLQTFLHKHKIPVEVIRDYTLPEYANKKTLVFAISYSGNTEETVAMYRVALRKGCKIIAIASGGKIEELSKRQKIPFIRVPRGIQPRQAVAYMFVPLLNVLAQAKIIKDPTDEVKKAAHALKNPKLRSLAVDLSEKLVGRIPVIYSSSRCFIYAYKWKISFNENTKIHAFSNEFSELNHNEIVGFTDLKGSYYVIMLRDDEDHKKIKDRFSISKHLIKQKGVPVTEVSITGSTVLTKMFIAMYLGDLTSYNLALRYKTDPTPVHIVEDLKKKLK